MNSSIVFARTRRGATDGPARALPARSSASSAAARRAAAAMWWWRSGADTQSGPLHAGAGAGVGGRVARVRRVPRALCGGRAAAAAAVRPRLPLRLRRRPVGRQPAPRQPCAGLMAGIDPSNPSGARSTLTGVAPRARGGACTPLRPPAPLRPAPAWLWRRRTWRWRTSTSSARANSTGATVRGGRSTGPKSATTTSLVRGRSRAPKR